MEMDVAGADPADPVLAHDDGDSEVVEKGSADIGQFVDGVVQHVQVTVSGSEQFDTGGVEERADECHGCLGRERAGRNR